MQNFGTIIDNFDAVTKQYVDDKASAKRIRGIKVDNATLADTAKKVQNAFTYKAHNKAAGTVIPITYDGNRAASLDFSANDFTYDYNSFNDIKIKLAEDVKTSLRKADTALQNVPSYNDLPNIPVINQDLSASGFTPVANTYYRHTGATTATFTQGVIYLYNGTGYAALDGSGSGGGKTYKLVKKTVRLSPVYNVNTKTLTIELPTSVGKNFLDIIKENNNCSLRLYRGLDTMTALYVDLQPHQYEDDSNQNPTKHTYYYTFTSGFRFNTKAYTIAVFSAIGYIANTVPNKLIMTNVASSNSSMGVVDFYKGTQVTVMSAFPYDAGKTTIADLIWWELEEVTE